MLLASLCHSLSASGLGELHSRDEVAAPTGRCRARLVHHDIGKRAVHAGAPWSKSVRFQAFHTEFGVPILSVRQLRLQEAWCC